MIGITLILLGTALHELILAIVGITIVVSRKKLLKREFLFTIAVLTAVFLLFEGGLRLRSFWSVGPYVRPSEALGWKTKANVAVTHFCNGYGMITYSTARDGFRCFGDPQTKKKKIFVVGDSYTQAITVSDGETYYGYLAKHNPSIEIFAYGCSGYGSLQEYMILDGFYQAIKPEIVLWQFCSNDLIDNSHKVRTYMDEDVRVRPYYINQKIEYLHPNCFLLLTFRSSYLLRFFATRVFLLRERFSQISYKDLFRPALDRYRSGGPQHDIYTEAIGTTIDIMRLAKEKYPNVDFLGFSANEMYEDEWDEIFQFICKESGIEWIPGINQALLTARRAGVTIDGGSYDSHWNSTGHSIVGKTLLTYLMQNQLVRK